MRLQGGKIYLVKIPYNDVYFTSNSVANTVKETEYLIPDVINSDEIIKLFDVDDFRGLFYYLKNEIGLDIVPEDIGLSYELLTNGKYIPGFGVQIYDSQQEIDNSNIKGFKR